MSIQFNIEKWTKEKFDDLSWDDKSIDYAEAARNDFKVIRDFRNGSNLIVYFFKVIGELEEGHHHLLTPEQIAQVIETMNNDEAWKDSEEKKMWVDRLSPCVDQTNFDTHVLTWSYWL